MRSTKFIALGLILMGVGATSFTQLYAKQSIHPNVVYSIQNPNAQNTSHSNKKGFDKPGFSVVDDEAETYYRTQTADALKKYFNISLEHPTEQNVMLVSADAAGLSEHFNHDYVVVDNYTHLSYFNANTKEILMLCAYDTAPHDDKAEKIATNVDGAQFEKLGADFIKQYQLGGLENPKFIKATGTFLNESFLLYEDANNASKKAIILVNCDKKKVIGFYIKDFADEMQRTLFK